ncbi:MAG: DMT family protein [Rhodospirillaceae bacterium]|nr:DMT family protein [Rhodospirillaceae bacterium]
MPTILLLSASNILMTIAWYWHLKHKAWPLWQVVLISWGIAFFEYSLAVPANRLGYGQFTAPQLKILQEVIALAVFAVFAVIYLGVPIRWNYIAACACVLAAVFFILFF